MNFTLKRRAAPSVPPVRPAPRLDVFFSKLENAPFGHLAQEIKHFVSRVRDASPSTGPAMPAVLLFCENAFSCRYNIRSSDLQGHLEYFSSLLTEQPWTALAFNVLEMRDQAPSNTAYLISSNAVLHASKRELSGFDSPLPSNDTHDSHDQDDAWVARGQLLSRNKEPHLSLLTPDGLRLEYRVGVDTRTLPIVSEPDTVTLVSAYALRPKFVAALSRHRQAVFINDSAPLREPWPSNVFEKFSYPFPMSSRISFRPEQTENVSGGIPPNPRPFTRAEL